MSLYRHAETFEKLAAFGNCFDKTVAYYKKHGAAINAEIAARQLERKSMIAADWVEVSPIDPCAPIESVIDAEMRAMHEWKQRAVAKAQNMPCVQPGPPPDRRAPFPAVVLPGRVMRVGVRYER